MNEDLAKFGRRIRQLRQARGWSQEELAFQVKLDRTYIGGVERGERNISLQNICRLARAFGIEAGDLFKESGVDNDRQHSFSH